ncbi:hypothetical protein [Paraburkholderia phytofirmans]|uniref:hypothetical protein n=1 Tax=Paraburkholderia phytofirmans TaxID=261302 RepID=UPI001427BF5A|nr:hypothetical protein [Paraburkholderia phytofirmans]
MSAARFISPCSQLPKHAIDPAATATHIHSVLLKRIVYFLSGSSFARRQAALHPATLPSTAGGGLGKRSFIGIGASVL